MADTDLAPDGGAATPDPRFTTRAELEAWAAGVARDASEAVVPETRAQKLERQLRALDRIRRVTLAHVHLGDDCDWHALDVRF